MSELDDFVGRQRSRQQAEAQEARRLSDATTAEYSRFDTAVTEFLLRMRVAGNPGLVQCVKHNKRGKAAGSVIAWPLAVMTDSTRHGFGLTPDRQWYCWTSDAISRVYTGKGDRVCMASSRRPNVPIDPLYTNPVISIYSAGLIATTLIARMAALLAQYEA